MAKRQVSTEPTTTGSFICCFAMVYFSLLTTTHETPDEVKEAAAAEVAEEYDHPGSFAVAITTDTSPSPPPPQEVRAAPNNGNLHPVTRIVQEKELGKAVIAIAVAIAMATAVAEYDHPGSFAVAITTDTSPSPPPPKEVQAAPNNGNLHPVIRIVQEKELGKAVIAIAVAIAMATAVAGVDKLGQSEMTLILVLESFAIAAILNGILLKDTYVEFAKIVEPVGIILVAISFYAVVGLFLPAWALWLPAVCIGFILVPFAIAVWQPPPT